MDASKIVFSYYSESDHYYGSSSNAYDFEDPTQDIEPDPAEDHDDTFEFDDNSDIRGRSDPESDKLKNQKNIDEEYEGGQDEALDSEVDFDDAATYKGDPNLPLDHMVEVMMKITEPRV